MMERGGRRIRRKELDKEGSEMGGMCRKERRERGRERN